LAAGATLCKGLNRGLGTLLAGLLAFIVGYIANASSHRISQAVIIGAAVFLIGTLHTFPNFPRLEKNTQSCDLDHRLKN